MQFNYLALAIPFFLLFMLLEFAYAKKKGLRYFKLHNSIANISIGIAERLTDVFTAGFFYFVYDALQKKYGLFDIKPGIALWILLFILTDFIWYWYHRLAHEINLLWMAHVVHHQSEDFNYTVSARITVFQALARGTFWCILPLIGFPAPMIASLLLVHGLYPFFIHTRVIGKLGILEYILVTPSHHRVHHASNEKYLDKNYGDVLIVWDKLFGTFQKEEDGQEIVYGLTQPLRTYSFLWQHFHFAIELWLAVRSHKGLIGKMKVLFGRPDKLQHNLRNEAEQLFHIRQNPVVMTKPLNKYVVVQMLALLLGISVFIGFEDQFSVTFKTGFVLLVLLSLINCGAIMEQKRWVFQVELVRLSLIALIPFYYPEYPATKLLVIGTAVAVLAYYYRPAKTLYLSYVYRSRSGKSPK
jgi:alkylglycerol monooxygenase